MNLGIDLGRVIVGPKVEGVESFAAPQVDNAFEVISKLSKIFDNIYVVSRVNTNQRERAQKWLENNDFYNITGVKKENVYFCFERRDKALFARGLNIGVFIDDRPDCLIPMNNTVTKILFNPYAPDLEKHKDNLYDLIIVKTWKEVEKLLIS